MSKFTKFQQPPIDKSPQPRDEERKKTTVYQLPCGLKLRMCYDCHELKPLYSFEPDNMTKCALCFDSKKCISCSLYRPWFRYKKSDSTKCDICTGTKTELKEIAAVQSSRLRGMD